MHLSSIRNSGLFDLWRRLHSRLLSCGHTEADGGLTFWGKDLGGCSSLRLDAGGIEVQAWFAEDVERRRIRYGGTALSSPS